MNLSAYQDSVNLYLCMLDWPTVLVLACWQIALTEWTVEPSQ